MAASLVSVGVAQAISGGTTVPVGTYPFVARIDLGSKACSGVLVDPSWVLTSAQCLSPGESGAPELAATVAVGDVNVGSGAGHVTKVTKVVRRTDRGVVLAKLAAAATGVQQIAISGAAPTAGETLQVAGFGRTKTDWVPDRPQVAPFTVTSVTGSAVAMTSADGVDTCKGDAGGPAFRVVNGQAQLVALNDRSWQHGCLDSAETRQGSTEVRVDDLGDWVRKQVVPNAAVCPGGAVIWTVRPDGGLFRYVHHTPLDAGLSWTTPSSAVGAGWRGRMLAGTGGVVWDFHRNNGSGDPYPDGALKRWVWNGSSWSGGQQVGSGWSRYLTAEFKNRVTIDEKGRIFAINDTGELRVYLWNETTNSWVNGVGEVLDTGWGKFDSITAAGDGVLYARQPNGNLYRFKYDFGAKAWTQRNKPAGVGWQMFSEIFSPGADILYGRGSHGANPWDGSQGPILRWYRHFDNTDTWAPAGPDGSGKAVGSGWNTEIHVSAQPNSCTLVP
ncbi:tachylectin-related carbohydrate-binding protein [Actinocrispum sp. NPDC049592]|uniref:tachylectin-related carbohydrate-binding protein n=1 Tax=Actinocrispum sp. NPDC049592 TaxID=3154835 RepID=UPI003429D844